MKPHLRQLCQQLKSTSEDLKGDPLNAEPLGQLRKQLREDINSRVNGNSAIKDPEVVLAEYFLVKILDDMWTCISGVASATVSRNKMREMLGVAALSLRDLSDSLEKSDVYSCYSSYSALLSTFLNTLKEEE